MIFKSGVSILTTHREPKTLKTLNPLTIADTQTFNVRIITAIALFLVAFSPPLAYACSPGDPLDVYWISPIDEGVPENAQLIFVGQHDVTLEARVNGELSQLTRIDGARETTSSMFRYHQYEFDNQPSEGDEVTLTLTDFYGESYDTTYTVAAAIERAVVDVPAIDFRRFVIEQNEPSACHVATDLVEVRIHDPEFDFEAATLKLQIGEHILQNDEWTDSVYLPQVVRREDEYRSIVINIGEGQALPEAIDGAIALRLTDRFGQEVILRGPAGFCQNSLFEGSWDEYQVTYGDVTPEFCTAAVHESQQSGGNVQDPIEDPSDNTLNKKEQASPMGSEAGGCDQMPAGRTSTPFVLLTIFMVAGLLRRRRCEYGV